MAKFNALEALRGFDPKAGWQMVPLYLARGIRLTDGAGLKLVGNDEAGPDALTFKDAGSPDSKDRQIWLQGRKAGHYWVQARDPSSSAVRAHLDVSVLPERVVNVAYYIIQTSDFKEDVFTQAEAREMHTNARTVLLSQANVRYESVKLESLTPYLLSGIGLGGTVGNWTTEERQKLLQAGNHPAAAHLVYLVRAIKTPEGTDNPNGFTHVNFTLIKNRDAKQQPYYLTLAHEMGHFLSGEGLPKHDNSAKDNLMFDGSVHGAYLPKDRILRWFSGLGDPPAYGIRHTE